LCFFFCFRNEGEPISFPNKNKDRYFSTVSLSSYPSSLFHATWKLAGRTLVLRSLHTPTTSRRYGQLNNDLLDKKCRSSDLALVLMVVLVVIVIIVVVVVIAIVVVVVVVVVTAGP